MIKLIALVVNIASCIATATITIDAIRKRKKQEGKDWKEGLELSFTIVFFALLTAIIDTLWLLNKGFNILQLIFMFVGCLLCNLGLYCSMQPCEYRINVLPGFICSLLGYLINGLGICWLA